MLLVGKQTNNSCVNMMRRVLSKFTRFRTVNRYESLHHFIETHIRINCNYLFTLHMPSFRHLATQSSPVVLGIETSCDDTGAALVTGNGTVLGEYIHSQQSSHLR